MAQYQITKSTDLSDEEETLKQAGWVKDLLLRYDAEKLKRPSSG
jgi:hypothetical protein